MARPETVPKQEIPDWLETSSIRALGPSWVFSTIFHVLTAFLLWKLAQTPGCQPTRGEQIVERSRDVGIVVRDAGETDTAEAGSAPAAGLTTEQPNAQPLTTPPVEQSFQPEPTVRNPATTNSPLVPDRPPVPLARPSRTGPRTIGMGPPPESAQAAARAAGGPTVSGRTATGLGQGDLGSGPGQKTGTGVGQGTSMFGIAAKGKTFVYAIDRSSSMVDVLPAAKGELLGSIQRLDEKQSFQVVFFNNEVYSMPNRFGMFHGVESDRLAVRERLSTVNATGGTRRYEALLEALKWSPDVIYFLTDSDDPMTAAELEQIRQRSRGAVQIHCIEFGDGPQPAAANGQTVRNFLHKLAAQSGGQYVYREIGHLTR